MKIIQTETGLNIRFYADAKEGSMKRYNEFNKYLLLDAGVGCTMEDIAGHFSKLFGFLSASKIEDARLEAENLYFNNYAVLEKINFKSYAFACLVESINGVQYDDFSEDGLKLVLSMLESSGITQQTIEQAVDDVKKK